MSDVIQIKGARLHNLKGIDLSIPINKITLVSGVSGSGKSSLVFDLLGQWSKIRFLEIFSQNIHDNYNLDSALSGSVDLISPIVPPVMIKGHITNKNPNSNVSTITGLNLLIRRLIELEGIYICPKCSDKIKIFTIDQIVNEILEKYLDKKGLIKAYISTFSDITKLKEAVELFGIRGFLRFEVNKKIFLLDEFDEIVKDVSPPFSLSVIVDRIIPRPKSVQRIYDSLRTAFEISKKNVSFSCESKELVFSNLPFCKRCNEVFVQDELERSFWGLDFNEILGLSIGKCAEFLNKSNELSSQYSKWLINIIREYLNTFLKLDLKHLSLSRSAPSLSAGELLKVNIVSTLTKNMSGVLYIFDEIVSLLPKKERRQICFFLQELVKQGNTCVIIEHCNEAIEIADHFIMVGPGAGDKGGQLLYEGSDKNIVKKDLEAPFSFFDSEKKRISLDKKKFIDFDLAKRNNFKGGNIRLLKGDLNVVFGQTGSGKSTLLEELFHQIKSRSSNKNSLPVFIEQVPAIPTRYSLVCSYIGIYSFIRRIFSATKDAQLYGITSDFFSISKKGGRCEACKGSGVSSQGGLLSQGEPCPVCKGSRFNSSILQIKYKDKNIAEVLDMTCIEAANFFSNYKSILRALNLLERIGLSYLRLGQPLFSLSSGEKQRLKLARFLQKSNKSMSKFILLDQPSKGLHPKDIVHLYKLLKELCEKGHTVLFAENNELLIQVSPWHIELSSSGEIIRQF